MYLKINYKIEEANDELKVLECIISPMLIADAACIVIGQIDNHKKIILRLNVLVKIYFICYYH